MEPLKHIYPIRNEEIISELSPTDVRIGKLEIEVEELKSDAKKLEKRIDAIENVLMQQTEINKRTFEVLQDINSRLRTYIPGI